MVEKLDVSQVVKVGVEGGNGGGRGSEQAWEASKTQGGRKPLPSMVTVWD